LVVVFKFVLNQKDLQTAWWNGVPQVILW
jgi:hypothetical protein